VGFGERKAVVSVFDLLLLGLLGGEGLLDGGLHEILERVILIDFVT